MAKMTVHPRSVHRCDYSDACGKPRTAKGLRAERRTIKRRSRHAWKVAVVRG